jgi:hypothetical protein
MNLLNLCKLLLDEDRLRVIGLLALEPLSQTELMERASMKAGVLARHLYQLHEARLVIIHKVDGVDHYALNSERILELKRQLFAPPPDEQPKSEEEEVLSRFTENGRLSHLPTQHAKMVIVLAWLAEQFEPGVDYPERVVNEILDKHGSDYATLRRMLIDYQFLTRSGGIYRRVS